MKKSYKKIIIFELIVLLILLVNIFTNNVINNFLVFLFLLSLIFIFKKIFGVEKESKRHTKELIIELSIIYIIFFVIFYLFGLITGYYKNNNYINVYGITTFIIPTILIIVSKEYLRFLVHTKFEDSKVLYYLTFLMFVMLDLVNIFKMSRFSSIQFSVIQSVFYFIATSLLPIISNNITANNIIRKSSYKVNIFWLLILNLYVYILPIIPNIGDYILSIIKIILPLIIYSRINYFYENEEDKEVEREYNKKTYLPYVVSVLFTIFLVYFSSGFFRFHAVAIASGSMTPFISKGDIVVIDKKYDDLKVDQIIAYKYKNIIVVHRLVKIIEKDNTYYYYTKGDANNLPDNYVINKEDIIGIVNIKIPYLGLPTVWLNDL